MSSFYRHRQRDQQGLLRRRQPAVSESGAFALVPLSPISRQTIRRGEVGNNAFRGPGSRNVDLSIVKLVPLGGFRRLELRADLLNAMNWTNFRTIQTNINASKLGRVIGTASARVVQLQARFGF